MLFEKEGSMSEIIIEKTGITKIGTECIVNAANSDLFEGGGVCGVIFKAAGSDDLNMACRALGHCNTGEAVITPAFRLNARYIIHAVGPVYHDGQHNEERLLYNAYHNSLKLMMEYNCHSIGFPLISAGIYGYPKKEAFKTAIRACQDFIRQYDYDIMIKFAIIDDDIYDIGMKILKEMEIYDESNS